MGALDLEIHPFSDYDSFLQRFTQANIGLVAPRPGLLQCKERHSIDVVHSSLFGRCAEPPLHLHRTFG